MNDKEKLKVIKHYLEETYKDSREYMDDFYEQCKDGGICDLDWVKDDKDFSNFIDSQDIEHIRIYDYALMELSARLLKKLNIEI